MRSRALFFASAVVCASTIPAVAISWNTQMNCASDYYAYCSKHVAGSAGCHACMRANRTKLSGACVSALIDDGVLPKSGAAQQKPKLAVSKPKAKPAARTPARLAAKPVVKAKPAADTASKPAAVPAPPVENAVPASIPAAASPVESAGTASPPEAASSAAATASAPQALARAPEPAATPPQQPEVPAATPVQQVETAPGIDQQTFEALKNRAPFFVATPETLLFEETAANAVPQWSVPR
jgi:hypothetical protein